MRQNPTSWKGCVRGAAQRGAGHSYTGNRGHSRANTCAKKPDFLDGFSWRSVARRGAGNAYMGNRGSSRANTCAKPDLFGMVVFAARRGVARVILTWVTVVVLELMHASNPGRVVFAALRGAARVILTWVTLVILELIHAPKPVIFGRVVFAARGAGHTYMDNRGHSRANTCAKTRLLGMVVFVARRGAGHSCTGNRGHSRANTCAKTRFLGRVVFVARRGAGHSYTGNRGHSRANTCSKTRFLGRVVFAARRGVARVILTWVTVVVLELMHAPKPGRVVFAARRGAGHSYMGNLGNSRVNTCAKTRHIWKGCVRGAGRGPYLHG